MFTWESMRAKMSDKFLSRRGEMGFIPRTGRGVGLSQVNRGDWRFVA